MQDYIDAAGNGCVDAREIRRMRENQRTTAMCFGGDCLDYRQRKARPSRNSLKNGPVREISVLVQPHEVA